MPYTDNIFGSNQDETVLDSDGCGIVFVFAGGCSQ
jgi:hypothetical protein